jgi:tRNA pseudouridine38-40 synthase
LPTYRLEIAYDGAGYHGFARQPGLRTVQGELEGALERIVGAPVETTGAGRTDAGVHARRQVVSFVVPAALETGRVVRSLGGMLGPETAVAGCVEVEDGFSARFSATWREYRYSVLTTPTPDPLLRHTTWHVPGPLDLEAMGSAAARLVGEHDFAGFCRAAEGRSTVREVLAAGWEMAGDLAVFTVRATSFCHQMVRSMTGWCVEVGRDRRPPEATSEVLATRDRSAAGPVAPPHGLVLWDVGYG